MLVLLYGCGSVQQPRLAHEAKQLRAQVPGLLHSDQRQALLFAVAAQKIAPTVEANGCLPRPTRTSKGCTDSASLVVATAQKAVAKIDLGTLRGVTLVSQGQFVGAASVVAGGGPGETVTLCTSRGLAVWEPRTHSIQQIWGAPCTGLARSAQRRVEGSSP
jgi:hypothetical protein